MKRRKQKNNVQRLMRRFTRRGFDRLRDMGPARLFLIQLKDERENGPWAEEFEKLGGGT